MVRKILSLLFFLSVASVAHANQRYTGYCHRGGQQLQVSGITGSITNPYTLLAGGNYVEASYPFCTVTVYLTGTTTLVPSANAALGITGLSSDAAGLVGLQNPFTADQYGVFYFYMPNGSRVDAALSGANIPTWTIGDIFFCDGCGGGGGGGGGTLTNFASGNLAPLFNTNVTNPTTNVSQTFSFINAPPGTVFGNPAIVAAPPVYFILNLSNIPGTISCSQLPAFIGDISIPVADACTATIAAQNKKRVCMIDVGTDDGPVLVSSNLGPQLEQCQIGQNSTVYEIDVAANTGQPSVIVAKRHCTGAPCVPGASEAVSQLVSAAVTPGSGGATACSNANGATGIDTFTTCSATLQNTSIFPGDWIELLSGTADGVAKRMSIAIHFTVN